MFGSVDMVSIIDPTVYIDVISTPANGSRSYSVPAGYSLRFIVGVNHGGDQPTVQVNGSTISWQGVNNTALLWVFLGR